MGRYIKKHRDHFAWVLLPLILMGVFGFMSMSVFPGWIRPAFSTIGAQCQPAGTNSADPLLAACDPCRGEFCSFDGLNSTCAQDYGILSFPQCQCVTSLSSIPLAQTNLYFFSTSFGGFNDSFCQNISGGDADNLCRVGVCTVSTQFDPANPSGCDFTFDDANTACINCAPPTPADVNCGNGVCEEGIGESFSSCAEDCRVPGYPLPDVLPEGDPILDDACNLPLSSTITFGGNIIGSDACEDGDVCTTNTCTDIVGAPNTCDVEPADCGGNNSDFCCPSGCNPPPDGAGTCNTSLDPNCDEDCLVEQQCEPTPPPTPVPPTLLEISGTSLICSLSDRGPAQPWKGALSLASLFLAMGVLAVFRKAEARK